MIDGYIYGFSNVSMAGILKIGITERTPNERLREANASDTWRPPTPYKIEFAKKVSDVSRKERALHALLEQYAERINPRREFFRVSPDTFRRFLDLMDGEMWINTNDENDNSAEDDDISSELDMHVKPAIGKGCRDMAKCFTDGQRIRHTIGIDKTWIGIYDSKKNGIVYDGKTLTLNKFVVLHFQSERPDRVPSANAWKECECEVDGQWISTYSLSS